MSSLNRRMARGAGWMVLLRFCYRGIGVVSTIILARLLVPADFGIVAMAMAVIAAFEMMTAFGFDLALIQKQDATRDHYDTAWTFNVCFAVIAASLVIMLSGTAENYFNEPRLQPVLCILAANFAIAGLENVAVVDFRKNLTFDKEFRLRIAQKIAMFSVTVPLAFLLRSYWALVAGMVTGKILKVALSYWYLPYRPRFSFSEAASMFGFSKWVFLNRILIFLHQRAGHFILGRIAGTQALGVYTIADEISQLSGSEIATPVSRAVFPGYAKMSHDTNVLRQGYFDVLSAVSILALPAAFGLAATADLVVPLVLGDRWLAAIPVIQVLAIAGAFRSMNMNSGPVFLALGKPNIVTILATFNVAVVIPVAILMVNRSGAVGLAWAYLASFSIVLPVTYALTLRALRGDWRSLIRCFWRPAVGTAVMYVTVRQLRWELVHEQPSVPELLFGTLLTVGGGVLTYAAAVALLWHLSGRPSGIERTALRWLRARFLQQRTSSG